jgi:cellobiose transport system permease protein
MRSRWKTIKRNHVAYLYIAPFFILFFIFGLYPILSGFVVSFFNWDGSGPMQFVAFKNYQILFKDRLFWKSISNTLYIGLISHVFILLGGLALAFILNSQLVKFENVFKTIYFLPMVTSAVATSIVFQSMFGLNSGLINYLLHVLGFPRIDWFGGKGHYIKVAVIIMFSWKWIGWNMVIYLAGMQGISKDIYEASKLDGANSRQTFNYITLPLLKPIILFTLIQSTIGTFNIFTEPFILTGGRSLSGGTANEGLTAMMYLLNKAPYSNNHYGYASAVAYVISIMIMIISFILNRTMTDPESK